MELDYVLLKNKYHSRIDMSRSNTYLRALGRREGHSLVELLCM